MYKLSTYMFERRKKYCKRHVAREELRDLIVVPAARLKKGTVQGFRFANFARIFINLSWYDSKAPLMKNPLDIPIHYILKM